MSTCVEAEIELEDLPVAAALLDVVFGAMLPPAMATRIKNTKTNINPTQIPLPFLVVLAEPVEERFDFVEA